MAFGKAVGVDTGSTGDMYATKHMDEDKFSDVRKYEEPVARYARPGGGSYRRLQSATSRRFNITSRTRPTYKVVERIPTGELIFDYDGERQPTVAEGQTTRSANSSDDGFIAKLHEKWFGYAKPESDHHGPR